MTATMTSANNLVGYKFGYIYKVENKIGSGSFGEIHKGIYKKKKTERGALLTNKLTNRH